MSVDKGLWDELDGQLGHDAVDKLRARLSSPDAIEYTPSDFADAFNCEDDVAERALVLLAQADLLRSETHQVCAVCAKKLSERELEERACPNGHTLERAATKTLTLYFRVGKQGRDVRWVIAIHGMNTRGPWQEELSWLLAQAYGYAVPVFIHKYGHIVVSPLLMLRQRTHRKRLLAALRNRVEELRGTKFDSPPDIVAHSFGTWLLADALREDRDRAAIDRAYQPLRVGRVILTGSIVRPDFRWQNYIDSGAVQAIFCHCGGRDMWVRIAHFAIPCSGPSGHRGFNRPSPVIHRLESDFAHSDYLDRDRLRALLRGPWGAFLTAPHPAAAAGEEFPSSEAWRESNWRFASFVLKYIVLALALGLAAMMAIALVRGTICLLGP